MLEFYWTWNTNFLDGLLHTTIIICHLYKISSKRLQTTAYVGQPTWLRRSVMICDLCGNPASIINDLQWYSLGSPVKVSTWKHLGKDFRTSKTRKDCLLRTSMFTFWTKKGFKRGIKEAI